MLEMIPARRGHWCVSIVMTVSMSLGVSSSTVHGQSTTNAPARDKAPVSVEAPVTVEAPVSVEAPVTVEAEAPSDAFDASVHLQSLRKVWQTIHDVHWDRERIDAKWANILPDFERQLAKAETDEQSREVIQAMIGRLEQSHFGIIPEDVYKRQDELGIVGGNGILDVSVRRIDGELVVTRVGSNGPAFAAGLRPGDRIDQIRDKTAAEILDKATEVAEFEAGRAETFSGLLSEALLGGAVGGEVPVAWTDADGNAHEATLTLAASKGEFAKFGHLPAVEVVLDTDELPGNVLLYRFSSFFNPVPLVTAMKDMMETHSDARGLILDVRGNRGGIVLMVCGLSNWLTDDPIAIGIMKSSQSELKLNLNPRKPRFRGKVVVLVDELSISSAEILAGGLQDASMATVIGSTTAGLVLPSIVTTLPNGDRFQYAISDFKTGTGRRLEGDGVTPDIVVPVTRQTLSAGGDPTLDRALRWIEDN